MEIIDTDINGVREFYDNKFKKDGEFSFRSPSWLLDKLVSKSEGYVSILDVGCGTGYLIKVLLSKGFNVKGCDISDKMIDFCKSEGLDVVFGNVEELPFFDSSFDCVYCCGVLEHTLNMEKGLKELLRVAKKKIVLLVPLYYLNVEELYRSERIRNIERWLSLDEWNKLFSERGYRTENSIEENDLLVSIFKVEKI